LNHFCQILSRWHLHAWTSHVLQTPSSKLYKHFACNILNCWFYAFRTYITLSFPYYVGMVSSLWAKHWFKTKTHKKTEFLLDHYLPLLRN
jgi:hypothetical protein